MKTLIAITILISLALASDREGPTIPTGFGKATLNPSTDTTFAYSWNYLEPVGYTDTLVFQTTKIASCSIWVAGDGLIIYSDGPTIIPDSWNVSYFPIDSSPYFSSSLTETINFIMPAGTNVIYIQKTSATIIPSGAPWENEAWIQINPISTKTIQSITKLTKRNTSNSPIQFDIRGRIIQKTHSYQIIVATFHTLKLQQTNNSRSVGICQ